MSKRNDIFDSLMTAVRNHSGISTYTQEQVEYVENFTTKYSKDSTPLLMVLDTGREEMIVEDATHYRYAWVVEFMVYVVGSSWDATKDNLNQATSVIKDFINSAPSIGVLDMRLQDTDGIQWDAEKRRAFTTVPVLITYVRTKSTSEAASTDVHDTDWSGTAHSKIDSLIDALQTTLSTQDPKFTNVYDGHRVANLDVPAVTIDIEEIEEDVVGAGSFVVRYYPHVSIRVHTGYLGGLNDTVKQRRLITSIVNKLRDNVGLADDYRIEDLRDIRIGEEFSGSATYGATVTAVVAKGLVHTQE